VINERTCSLTRPLEFEHIPDFIEEMDRSISSFSPLNSMEHVFKSIWLELSSFLMHPTLLSEEMCYHDLKHPVQIPGYSETINYFCKHNYGTTDHCATSKKIEGLRLYPTTPSDMLQHTLDWLYITREMSTLRYRPSTLNIFKYLGYIAMHHNKIMYTPFNLPYFEEGNFKRSLNVLPRTAVGYRKRIIHVSTKLERVIINIPRHDDDVIKTSYICLVSGWCYIYLCSLLERAYRYVGYVSGPNRVPISKFISTFDLFTSTLVKGNHLP
jgi:hypothetical protein